MSPATQRTPLIAALEQLGPHDHFCSIYENREEHYRGCPRRTTVSLKVDAGELRHALVLDVPSLPQSSDRHASAVLPRVSGQANQTCLRFVALSTQFVVRRSQLEVRSGRTQPLRVVADAYVIARLVAAVVRRVRSA